MARITSTANPVVRAARRLARSPGDRRSGTFVVEGPQAVRAAAGALDRLFVTDSAAGQRADLVRAARDGGAEIVQVSDAVLAVIATTVSPQGLVGVARLPFPPLDEALAGATLVVVLVGVADPGNVGTIVRSADAAGADAVLLTSGSADPRNPKAVRASAGSIFSLPVVAELELEQILAACRRHGLALLATSPRGALDCDRTDLVRPLGLVCGNEARGLPDSVVAQCDAAIRVPQQGRAESMNLAAAVAVLTYEAARQRRRARDDAP